MKPTLYYAPGTCALASRIAFEEVGAEVDHVCLDLAKGDNLTPAYLSGSVHGLDAFDLIEGKLSADGWVHGKAYTTSDAYLAVLFGWLAFIGESLRSLSKAAAHSARVHARPAVQRALATEKSLA